MRFSLVIYTLLGIFSLTNAACLPILCKNPEKQPSVVIVNNYYFNGLLQMPTSIRSPGSLLGRLGLCGNVESGRTEAQTGRSNDYLSVDGESKQGSSTGGIVPADLSYQNQIDGHERPNDLAVVHNSAEKYDKTFENGNSRLVPISAEETLNIPASVQLIGAVPIDSGNLQLIGQNPETSLNEGSSSSSMGMLSGTPLDETSLLSGKPMGSESEEEVLNEILNIVGGVPVDFQNENTNESEIPPEVTSQTDEGLNKFTETQNQIPRGEGDSTGEPSINFLNEVEGGSKDDFSEEKIKSDSQPENFKNTEIKESDAPLPIEDLNDPAGVLSSVPDDGENFVKPSPIDSVNVQDIANEIQNLIGGTPSDQDSAKVQENPYIPQEILNGIPNAANSLTVQTPFGPANEEELIKDLQRSQLGGPISLDNASGTLSESENNVGETHLLEEISNTKGIGGAMNENPNISDYPEVAVPVEDNEEQSEIVPSAVGPQVPPNEIPNLLANLIAETPVESNVEQSAVSGSTDLAKEIQSDPEIRDGTVSIDPPIARDDLDIPAELFNGNSNDGGNSIVQEPVDVGTKYVNNAQNPTGDVKDEADLPILSEILNETPNEAGTPSIGVLPQFENEETPNGIPSDVKSEPGAPSETNNVVGETPINPHVESVPAVEPTYPNNWLQPILEGSGDYPGGQETVNGNQSPASELSTDLLNQPTTSLAKEGVNAGIPLSGESGNVAVGELNGSLIKQGNTPSYIPANSITEQQTVDNTIENENHGRLGTFGKPSTGEVSMETTGAVAGDMSHRRNGRAWGWGRRKHGRRNMKNNWRKRKNRRGWGHRRDSWRNEDHKLNNRRHGWGYNENRSSIGNKPFAGLPTAFANNQQVENGTGVRPGEGPADSINTKYDAFSSNGNHEIHPGFTVPAIGDSTGEVAAPSDGNRRYHRYEWPMRWGRRRHSKRNKKRHWYNRKRDRNLEGDDSIGVPVVTTENQPENVDKGKKPAEGVLDNPGEEKTKNKKLRKTGRNRKNKRPVEENLDEEIKDRKNRRCWGRRKENSKKPIIIEEAGTRNIPSKVETSDSSGEIFEERPQDIDNSPTEMPVNSGNAQENSEQNQISIVENPRAEGDANVSEDIINIIPVTVPVDMQNNPAQVNGEESPQEALPTDIQQEAGATSKTESVTGDTPFVEGAENKNEAGSIEQNASSGEEQPPVEPENHFPHVTASPNSGNEPILDSETENLSGETPLAEEPSNVVAGISNEIPDYGGNQAVKTPVEENNPQVLVGSVIQGGENPSADVQSEGADSKSGSSQDITPLNTDPASGKVNDISFTEGNLNGPEGIVSGIPNAGVYPGEATPVVKESENYNGEISSDSQTDQGLSNDKNDLIDGNKQIEVNNNVSGGLSNETPNEIEKPADDTPGQYENQSASINENEISKGEPSDSKNEATENITDRRPSDDDTSGGSDGTIISIPNDHLSDELEAPFDTKNEQPTIIETEGHTDSIIHTEEKQDEVKEESSENSGEERGLTGSSDSTIKKRKTMIKNNKNIASTEITDSSVRKVKHHPKGWVRGWGRKHDSKYKKNSQTVIGNENLGRREHLKEETLAQTIHEPAIIYNPDRVADEGDGLKVESSSIPSTPNSAEVGSGKQSGSSPQQITQSEENPTVPEKLQDQKLSEGSSVDKTLAGPDGGKEKESRTSQEENIDNEIVNENQPRAEKTSSDENNGQSHEDENISGEAHQAEGDSNVSEDILQGGSIEGLDSAGEASRNLPTDTDSANKSNDSIDKTSAESESVQGQIDQHEIPVDGIPVNAPNPIIPGTSLDEVPFDSSNTEERVPQDRNSVAETPVEAQNPHSSEETNNPPQDVRNTGDMPSTQVSDEKNDGATDHTEGKAAGAPISIPDNIMTAVPKEEEKSVSNPVVDIGNENVASLESGNFEGQNPTDTEKEPESEIKTEGVAEEGSPANESSTSSVDVETAMNPENNKELAIDNGSLHGDTSLDNKIDAVTISKSENEGIATESPNISDGNLSGSIELGGNPMENLPVNSDNIQGTVNENQSQTLPNTNNGGETNKENTNAASVPIITSGNLLKPTNTVTVPVNVQRNNVGNKQENIKGHGCSHAEEVKPNHAGKKKKKTKTNKKSSTENSSGEVISPDTKGYKKKHNKGWGWGWGWGRKHQDFGSDEQDWNSKKHGWGSRGRGYGRGGRFGGWR